MTPEIAGGQRTAADLVPPAFHVRVLPKRKAKRWQSKPTKRLAATKRGKTKNGRARDERGKGIIETRNSNWWRADVASHKGPWWKSLWRHPLNEAEVKSFFLSFSLAFQFVLKMFAGTKKGIGVDRRPPGVTCRPRVTHQSSPSNRSILYSRSARQEYERSCPYGRSSSKFIGNFGGFFFVLFVCFFSCIFPCCPTKSICFF